MRHCRSACRAQRGRGGGVTSSLTLEHEQEHPAAPVIVAVTKAKPRTAEHAHHGVRSDAVISAVEPQCAWREIDDPDAAAGAERPRQAGGEGLVVGDVVEHRAQYTASQH